MPLFSRRHAEPAAAATTTGDHGRAQAGLVKTFGLDVLTMAALGAIALGVYEADPAPSRSFAVTFQDGEVVYPQFAFPLRKNIIPIYAAALLAWGIPTLFFFGLMFKKPRVPRNLITAEMALLFSLITAATFQVFVKWLVGGLRPHFLVACQPVITTPGNGFGLIYHQRDVCTGDKNEINDSLESMPSGHSTAAGAGFVLLSLWLNAHLKIFGPTRSQLWKMALFFAPLLGACLIAGSLTIDEYHHWYDVLAGLTIGTLCAFAAYRTQYSAIWDWRYNHIPLPAHADVDYAMGDGALHGEKGPHHGPTAAGHNGAPLNYPAHGPAAV